MGSNGRDAALQWDVGCWVDTIVTLGRSFITKIVHKCLQLSMLAMHDDDGVKRRKFPVSESPFDIMLLGSKACGDYTARAINCEA